MAIVLLAGVRVFVPVLREAPHSRPTFAEVTNTAHALYLYGDWRDPFASFPTGPSAHVAPLYPLFLAGVYRVFGEGAAGSRAADLAEAAAMILGIALLPLATKSLSGDLAAGFLGACFAIAGARRMPESEANYAAVLLILATLLACRYNRALGSPATRSPWGLASLSGILWGAILLLNPAPIVVWIVWLALGATQSVKRGWRYAWTPALLVPVLMLLPWTLRNYRALGGFVPLRSNLGLELNLGNNPCATPTLRLNSRSGCYGHPGADISEAHKVAQLGEIQYNREQAAKALAWIRQNPRRAAALWMKRAELFWFPSENGTPFRALLSREHWMWTWTIDITTLLSIPGIVLLYRRNPAGAAICSAFLFGYPIAYYIVQYDPRYRYPITWVTFALGALGLRSLYSLWRGDARSDSVWMRSRSFLWRQNRVAKITELLQYVEKVAVKLEMPSSES